LPPHVPLKQSLLQQSADALQAEPSGLQLGLTHTLFVQLPLQQSLACAQAWPGCLHASEFDGATHTPEHDVEQQSLQDPHTAPSAAQEPPPSSPIAVSLPEPAHPKATAMATTPVAAAQSRPFFMPRSLRAETLATAVPRIVRRDCRAESAYWLRRSLRVAGSPRLPWPTQIQTVQPE
jgi:hypothetical protein